MGQHIAWLASRFGLFLGAYAPLCLIFGLRTSPKNLWQWHTLRPPSGIWFALAIVGTAYLYLLVKAGYRINAGERRFSAIDDQGAQVTGYLATYLLPFITPESPAVRDYIGYGVFFVSVFAVFLRSDMALINPTLYMLGYGVYRARWVTDGGDESVLILSHDRPTATGVIAANLGGIFVTRENREG